MQQLAPAAQVVQPFTIYGYENIQIGDITMSLHLELLTLLWVKMIRVQGYADLVWAKLTR